MTSPDQVYRLIPLTQGQCARVSSHRFEELSQHKWCALWSKSTETFYAVRTEITDGKRANVYMHRQILGLKFGDRTKGDHRNGDTLDNTDVNLRIATSLQNNRNRRISRNNTSGYKGVSQDARNPDLWVAYIKVDGKTKRLGSRNSPESAYEDLYIPAALKHHGEFARLG